MENIVGERIKELRKSLKLNQKEFGESVNVTNATISHIESGGQLSLDLLQKISHTYNISMAWILDGKGSLNAVNEIQAGIKIKAAESKEVSDTWAQQLVEQMKAQIEDLKKREEEARKREEKLTELLQLAISGNSNFPEGNNIMMTAEWVGNFNPEYSEVITLKKAA